MINVSEKKRKFHGRKITHLKYELRKLQYKRWVITYSWKHGYPIGDPQDWRSWRSFAKVPILFKTYEEAEGYLNNIGFKNLRHLRKISASINIVWLKEK